MNKLFTISIVVLALVAVGLGYLTHKQQTSNASLEPSQIQIDVPPENMGDTQAVPGDEKKVFLLVLSENTQVFGIAKENPYYGEPPVPIIRGGDIQSSGFSTSFEIWGDVVDIDAQVKTVSISSDFPRDIGTEFTPRGPQLSLEDIKEGDRIVASSTYDENGEVDYENIQFIQISPSLEEIKRLREAQNQ